MNLSIKVNLTKIPGAALVNLKGNTETKKCIVIPVEDANLFIGEKGVYLNMTALQYKEQKYADTHFLKQSLDKEVYNAMTKEQQDAMPVIGGVKSIVPAQMDATAEMEVVPPVEGEGSDLPF